MNEMKLREFVENLPGNLGLLAAHIQLHPDVAKNMCDHLAARARAVLDETCPCGDPVGGPPCTAERPCSYADGMPPARWWRRPPPPTIGQASR